MWVRDQASGWAICLKSPINLLTEGQGISRRTQVKVDGLFSVAIAVNDIDKATAYYSKLLGINFPRATHNIAKVEVAYNESAGLEIVSPLPGQDTPVTRKLTGFIERHGEGSIFMFAFRVDNADEASARAEKMGIGGWWTPIDWDELNHLTSDRVKNFKEYNLDADDINGAWVAFVEVEHK
jgi:catechol 2,3-dioxygenase-like lactoylglutathione lyase family enzyme